MESSNLLLYRELSHKYIMLELIGRGSFGQVHKGHLRGSPNHQVAIKQCQVQEALIPPATLNEIRLLTQMNQSGAINIVHLIEVCHKKSGNYMDIYNVYMVFEYCKYDLAGLLRVNSVKFTEPEIKMLAKQILTGVSHMHRQKIMHRDLKPANILLTQSGVVKIADFGCAVKWRAPYRSLSPNVGTLYIRSPEMLLGTLIYGTPVDLWSVGMIISQLYLKRPLVMENDSKSQLEMVLRLCGSIDTEDWLGARYMPDYVIAEDLGPMPSTLDQTLTTFGVSPLGRYLISGLLRLNPNTRLTADKALDSEYFKLSPAPVDLKPTLDRLP